MRISKKMEKAYKRLMDRVVFNTIDEDNLLDVGFELEHNELFVSATDTYLQFHLALKAMPAKVKRGPFTVGLMDENL